MGFLRTRFRGIEMLGVALLIAACLVDAHAGCRIGSATVAEKEKSKKKKDDSPKQHAKSSKKPKAEARAETPTLKGLTSAPIASIRFSKTATKKVLNASGVVALADSRFLFCDNLTNDSLYELTIAPGSTTGVIEKRPLKLPDGVTIDDLEAMTIVRSGDRIIMFAVTSLGMGAGKHHGKAPRPGGLLRIVEDDTGQYRADVVVGFREWLAARVPEVAQVHDRDPDTGGLNIEGLAWDEQRKALLVGLRTPVRNGHPLVVPIKVDDIEAEWSADRFECRAPIELKIAPQSGASGIRGIEFDPYRGVFLVLVGRATSGSNVPFRLYGWDGNENGTVSLFEDLWFDDGMKPESVASGTIGGKPVLVFVDDAGGYHVLSESDHRIAPHGIQK